MKILWFANTPCSAMEKLDLKGMRGGWLVSLEQELKKCLEIDLHVCFYYGKSLAPFDYKSVNYYPVHRKSSGSKKSRYIKKILGRTNNDVNELQQLLSVINTVKPDLIHVHGTEENFGLVQEHTSVPVVVSIQGLLNAIKEKYYAGISCEDAAKCESITEKLRFKSAAYLYNFLEQGAYREQKILAQAKYIIGRTDFDKRVTRVLAPSSNYFVGNEILRNAFYAGVREKQPNDVMRIVTVTSDGLYKGFETIVSAGKLLSDNKQLKFEWVVAGLNAQTGIVKTVTKLLKADLNNLNIKLVGFKNDDELAEIFSTSDLYCQVSHIENSPNSLCEAMLAGLPVVATFAGGTSSLLQNEVDGILVQSGDHFALAGAILELLNNRELANKYGTAARKKALHRHNKKTITEDLISVYKTIAQQHQQR